jgi:rod shape determining protein RodA
MDWALLLSMFVLMVMGILFIYSACFRSEDLPVSSFYKKQILWSFVGAAVFVTLVCIDYHRWGENAGWLYAVCLVLLILVLFLGKEVYGAHRWLSVFGIQMQPSELAKIGTIIVVARFLSRPGRNVRDFKVTVQTLCIVGLPFLLIAKEPDLGTAAMLIPITMVMLYVAGVPARTLAFLALLGLLLLPVGWLGLGAYQKERILVFFDPGRDPLNAGWNKMQSEIAVGSGGLLGKGYLKGTQNVLGFLPRTVAPTDFIYSVIAEEMGFVGSVVILVLFAVLLIACARSALLARDKFGRLLAVGVATLLFCHVFVNIAMTIGYMPITGLPLPLISYGGSFMVSTMIALGIVQSVYVRRQRR